MRHPAQTLGKEARHAKKDIRVNVIAPLAGTRMLESVCVLPRACPQPGPRACKYTHPLKVPRRVKQQSPGLACAAAVPGETHTHLGGAHVHAQHLVPMV